MIQENEIRTGNYYNRIESLNGAALGHHKFDASDWYAIGECIDSFENYDNIPLTEEILLKCGFEHTTEGGTQYFKIVIKYSKTLSLLQDDGESDYGAVLSVSNGTCTESQSVIGLGQMQHLHQLQNLYSALTNTELILNELENN